MQIIRDIEQGTEQWLALRFGWITASKFKDVMAGGTGKTRKSYMYQLAAEIITGERAESFTNEYMEWGNQIEPQARAMYELESGFDVDQVTFIKHDTLKAGCSPDGLVGESGLVEFKCPKTTTQIETFLSGKMPAIHVGQVQGQLWISEREWCDFVSFDPRINGQAHYFCTRVFRDEEKIKQIEDAVIKFEKELFETVGKLK
jgi:putative phage-type endonuclease